MTQYVNVIEAPAKTKVGNWMKVKIKKAGLYLVEYDEDSFSISRLGSPVPEDQWNGGDSL